MKFNAIRSFLADKKSLFPLMLVGATLIFLILTPMGLILIRSMIVDGEFRLMAAFSIIRDTVFVRVLVNTLLLGFLVVVTATAVALPLALTMVKTSLGRHDWIDMVLILPFLTPPYINSMGWIIFMQPQGYLHHLAPWAGDWSQAFFSLAGMVLIMALHLYPFLYLMLKNTLMQISGSLEEAAAVFGAGVFYRFRTITSRLLLSGYAMGALLVFVKALSEFGTPVTMGRRIGFPVMVTEIFRYTSSWPLDFGKGARYSFTLLFLCLGAWWVQQWISQTHSYHLVGGKGNRGSSQARSGKTLIGWVYLMVLLLFSIGIPYFSIIMTSFVRLRSQGLIWSNFTFEHYKTVFTSGSLGWKSLGWSFILSLASATLSTVMGTLIALALKSRPLGSHRSRLQDRLVGFGDALALLPNTVPSIVVVLGLILMWNAVWMPLAIYNTPMMLVVTYTILFLPFSVQYVKSSYEAIHPSLFAAARVCGGRNLYVFFKVVLPLILPGILSGWIMTFAISFRELVGSLIVRPPSIQTTATYIYSQFEQGSVSQGMAMAVVSVGLTTVVLVLVRSMAGMSSRK
jgi:iron(III) transport system permease protein